MTSPRRYYGTNARGNRLGVDHHHAKFTEGDIDLIFQLHKGDPERGISGLGYGSIARKFDCGKSTIRDVIKGITYAEAATHWARCG